MSTRSTLFGVDIDKVTMGNLLTCAGLVVSPACEINDGKSNCCCYCL